MTIIIENESGQQIEDKYGNLIEKVIEETVTYEKCPYEIEVSILLTDNQSIRELNKLYRKKDQVTDVLSFPLIDFKHPSDFKLISDETCNVNLDTNELMLGDIILSIETATEQAREYGHSFERELGFLIVHSMLHLFGYDHIHEHDAKLMFEKQKIILDKVGLKR